MAMTLTLRRRTRRHVRQAQPRTRAGMSIVEILVAMVLFGTVTIAMAGLSLVVARRADANDVFTKRTALLQQQMNWLQALPYDSVVKKEGTVEVTDGPFPHTREVSVSSNGSRTRVVVKVIPARAPDRAETIVFDRAKPTTSPLCKGC
jgi:Tfp pilus assembly protein PilV